jgi:hypothetical protein
MKKLKPALTTPHVSYVPGARLTLKLSSGPRVTTHLETQPLAVPPRKRRKS